MEFIEDPRLICNGFSMRHGTLFPVRQHPREWGPSDAANTFKAFSGEWFLNDIGP